MFFKKKNNAAKTVENRELIESNAKSIGALIVLANGNTDMIGELEELQEKLKYLIPSQDSKIIDYDKKIKNLIAELKKINPQVEKNIFRSVENVNLNTVIAYKDNNGVHNFLDEYDFKE